jgi:hypothetical protein
VKKTIKDMKPGDFFKTSFGDVGLRLSSALGLCKSTDEKGVDFYPICFLSGNEGSKKRFDEALPLFSWHRGDIELEIIVEATS